MHAFPAANQQRLLFEYGLHEFFMAQWVSVEDINEVARRLQVATEATVACDFQVAMRSYGSRSRGPWQAWIARLAPGWSIVIYLNGLMSSSDQLSLGGQRVFDVSYVPGIEIEELFYTHDGVCTGTIYNEEEYGTYWEDLAYDITSEEGQLEEYLCVMGRVAGRFLDHDLFSSQGLLVQLSSTD
ncbi:hypothetical protein [Sphaerimonospora thailandensis]|uniref:Uncharacterized protein n=1 Tax=Sphaerimonospora thailandensis TaxID=795644 RepID=A0A8J3R766_9ACTN|nr:hypothetical protein [Sphaerimonospora thailandensis]GIH69698.1 hypothetical protein Mth01_19510 [Sphaerimonospora thailandensis]